MALLYLFLLLKVVVGMTFIGPGPYSGIVAIETVHKAFFGGNYDQTIWGRNFSVVALPRGCPFDDVSWTSLNLNGKIAWFSGNGLPCSITEIQKFIASKGGVAGYSGTPVPGILMLQGNSGEFLRNGPVIFTSYLSIDGCINCQIFGSSLLFGLIPGALNDNITIALDYPQPTGIYSSLTAIPNSGAQVIIGFGCTLAIFIMIFAAVQFFRFTDAQGFSLSIPVIEFIVCFLGGIFIFIRCIAGTDAIWAQGEHEIFQFFHFWTYGLATTGSIVLGLFFKELSLLTSANTGTLDVMKWPALLIIVFLWAGILAVGGIGANEPTTVSVLNGNIPALTVSVFAIAFATALFIGGFGMISLFIHMQGSSSVAKGAIFRIALLTVSQLVILCSTGMLYVIIFVYPDLTIGYYFTELQAVTTDTSLGTFGTGVCFVLILMSFRLSVSKEIEVSKSGTSSTSSGGSSAASSSSSSSGSGDPVIEL